jgi:hypothetical protein
VRTGRRDAGGVVLLIRRILAELIGTAVVVIAVTRHEQAS